MAQLWMDLRLKLGEGEVKRVIQLLQQLQRLTTSAAPEPKAVEEGFASIRAQLAAVELYLDKAQAVADMNTAELASYAQLQSSIQSAIEKTKAEIEQAKEQLQTERRLKKNKQEYDLVATHVEQIPSRQDTQQRISEVQKEVADLEALKRTQENKLELRRKQFALLMQAARDLKLTLESEAEGEAAGSGAAGTATAAATVPATGAPTPTPNPSVSGYTGNTTPAAEPMDVREEYHKD